MTIYYKLMTGMAIPDTHFTGKLYPKLDAFIQNGKGAEIFCLCSTNQYKTQKKFKQSILEGYNLASNAIVIVKKA